MGYVFSFPGGYIQPTNLGNQRSQLHGFLRLSERLQQLLGSPCRVSLVLNGCDEGNWLHVWRGWMVGGWGWMGPSRWVVNLKDSTEIWWNWFWVFAS